VNEIVDQPTKLYFYHYRRVNIALDQVAILVTNYIQRQKHQALPIPSSQVVNWEKQLGTISHKEVAVKAGLGWTGRNNLLVNPDFGSAMRYITILTDLPLTTDSVLKQGCSECKNCLSICPANAIKESAADFDHLACFEKLKQFSKQCNIGHYICGICVKACTGERINNAEGN
jgi:epoxyqueuosine reductase QueG